MLDVKAGFPQQKVLAENGVDFADLRETLMECAVWGSVCVLKRVCLGVWIPVGHLSPGGRRLERGSDPLWGPFERCRSLV